MLALVILFAAGNHPALFTGCTHLFKNSLGILLTNFNKNTDFTGARLSTMLLS